VYCTTSIILEISRKGNPPFRAFPGSERMTPRPQVAFDWLGCQCFVPVSSVPLLFCNWANGRSERYMSAAFTTSDYGRSQQLQANTERPTRGILHLLF